MQAMQRLVLGLLVSMAITASAQGPTAAPAAPAPATPATPAAPAPASTKTTNITGVLAKAGQFNTLIRLMRSTGVAEQIDNQLNSSRNGLTVFAPTDNAFTSLPSGTLNSLSDQQKNSLVQYHVLSTLIPMSQFDTVSNPLRTQAGNNSPGQYPLNVTAEGQQVNISTGVVNATVDNTLFTGDNLVVYQVNKVLLPMAIYGTPAPAPAPLAPTKKKGKTPATSVADAPEAADATPDATPSLAAARVTAGAGVGVVLALVSVWLGL
ncbi:fasciclin-like arabinogalactan protein 11 isoform X1 [Oryza brachyantha]|uniref:fasciclin-like arabinogalactan protein 11 isoform X1 n=1 Tax=Oryza brachyantha TaxID=4533 RepID=UPI001ADCCC89|nr:fasciclin-like arabinogalactan protein 11 isoform X1 [Oryza brachyantha]